MASLVDRLRTLHASSPFWRARWEAAGIANPTELGGLPLLAPEDLARDDAAHPPFGTWRAVATGFVRAGWPTVPGKIEAVFFTAEDLAREARVGALALGAAGLSSGCRATNTLPGGLATPGSLIVGDAVQARGALDMPVGPLTTPQSREVAFDFWGRVRPDFAVLDVPSIPDLRALLAQKATTASGIGLRAIAVLTDLRDPEPDTAGFDVPVVRIVGIAEAFCLLAARGPDGVYRAPADEVVVEVHDGELLLTTLAHSAALVRYAPGVRATRVEVPDAASPGGHAAGFLLS